MALQYGILILTIWIFKDFVTDNDLILLFNLFMSKPGI